MAVVIAPTPSPANFVPDVPDGVCTSFLFKGRCRFADRCQFSHEVDRELYLQKNSLKSRQSRSTKSSGPFFESNDEPVPRCSRTPWRSIDFLLRGETVKTNKYLREFTAAPWLQGLVKAPECANLLAVRGRSLRKELTEAFAALAAVRRALGKLFPEGYSESDVRVVDICCGKGFGSLITALSMPQAQLLAVDLNPDMELAHFRHVGNLSFLELDITLPTAGDRVAAAIENVNNRVNQQCQNKAIVVYMGVHLCGSLSRHAAKLFRQASSPAVALVLAPCCLDGRQVIVKRRAKKLHIDPHTYWCLSLLFDEIPPGPTNRRELIIDHDVMSTKNSFLIGTRKST